MYPNSYPKILYGLTVIRNPRFQPLSSLRMSPAPGTPLRLGVMVPPANTVGPPVMAPSKACPNVRDAEDSNATASNVDFIVLLLPRSLHRCRQCRERRK